MSEIVVAVRVADLIAANQLVVEVAALVGAVGQVPPVVGDAAALRAAQVLQLQALRRLSVLLGNAGPAHFRAATGRAS